MDYSNNNYFYCNFLFKAPLVIFSNVYEGICNAGRIFSFSSEYKKFRQQSEQLQFKVNQLEEVSLENERLRKILELKEKESFQYY